MNMKQAFELAREIRDLLKEIRDLLRENKTIGPLRGIPIGKDTINGG